MTSSEVPDILTGTEQFMLAAGQMFVEGEEVAALRRKMLREEVKEYFDAEDDNDLVEMVDGLLDIIVVAWGTLLSYIGPDMARKCAEEVTKSNLAKIVDGVVLKNESGKVIKPNGWTGPQIETILRDALISATNTD